jgi:hypothetical protein
LENYGIINLFPVHKKNTYYQVYIQKNSHLPSKTERHEMLFSKIRYLSGIVIPKIIIWMYILTSSQHRKPKRKNEDKRRNLQKISTDRLAEKVQYPACRD